MITLPDRAEEKQNLALAKQRQMRTDHWTDKQMRAARWI